MSVTIKPSNGGILKSFKVGLMNLEDFSPPRMSSGAFTMSNAISGNNNQMRLQNLDGDIHFGAQMGNDAVFNAGWLTTASGQTLPGLQNLSGAHFTMKNISTGDDNTFQSLQNLCMMMIDKKAIPCANVPSQMVQSRAMMQPMSMMRI